MKVKDEKYLAYIRELPCWRCKGPGSVPHHVGDPNDNRRHRDDLVVPLCGRCHVPIVHRFTAFYLHELREAAVRYRREYERSI